MGRKRVEAPLKGAQVTIPVGVGLRERIEAVRDELSRSGVHVSLAAAARWMLERAPLPSEVPNG